VNDWVAAFMERVLGAIEDTFVAAEVDLPERRYITFGTPPADCAQLTVALQQLYLGPPGAPVSEPTPCSSPTTAVLRVELLREVPIPQDRDLTVAVPKLIASPCAARPGEPVDCSPTCSWVLNRACLPDLS
jgi:hypothetical protein